MGPVLPGRYPVQSRSCAVAVGSSPKNAGIVESAGWRLPSRPCLVGHAPTRAPTIHPGPAGRQGGRCLVLDLVLALIPSIGCGTYLRTWQAGGGGGRKLGRWKEEADSAGQMTRGAYANQGHVERCAALVWKVRARSLTATARTVPRRCSSPDNLSSFQPLHATLGSCSCSGSGSGSGYVYLAQQILSLA